MASRQLSRPPSQPSPYRHLGSGGQHPVRVQTIIALVAGLVLVAVPLYLWRRPTPVDPSTAAPPPEDAGASGATVDGAVPYVPLVDASVETATVKLSPFKSIRCLDPGPGKTAPEQCDHVTFFEDALSRAIRENALCAPSSEKGVSVSFVMELDFRRQKLKIYHGQSSSIGRAQTKELFRCVERSMPTPEWDTIPHQHAKYVVSVTATYPPSALF
jgi:hypothetical protein